MASNKRRSSSFVIERQAASGSSKQRQAASSSKQQAAASSSGKQQAAVAWIMPPSASGWHKLTGPRLQQRIDETYKRLPKSARAGFQRQLAIAGLPAAARIKPASGKRQARPMGKRRGEVATAITMLRYYIKLCSQWPLSDVSQTVWDWRDQQLDSWLQQGADLVKGKRQAASGRQEVSSSSGQAASSYSEQRRAEWYARLRAKDEAEQQRAAAAVKPVNPLIASLVSDAQEAGCYGQAAASSGSMASLIADLVKMQQQDGPAAAAAEAPAGEVHTALAAILAMRRELYGEAAPAAAAAAAAASGKVQSAAAPYRPAAGKAQPKAKSSGQSYAEWKHDIWASMAKFWQQHLESHRWSALAAERLSKATMQMQYWEFVRKQSAAA